MSEGGAKLCWQVKQPGASYEVKLVEVHYASAGADQQQSRLRAIRLTS